MTDLATTGALLASDNRCLGRGVFTGTVGTWATTPPISHLGWQQVPIPFAVVTPDTGEIEFTFQARDAADAAENFTLDTAALLAHSAANDINYRPGLPAGAIVKFLDGATELASIEYQPVANRTLPPNIYAVLNHAATLDTLTVNITNAGADPIRISGLWASESLRFRADRGLPIQPDDLSKIGRVKATRWPLEDVIPRGVSVTASMISEDQARGTEGGRNFDNIFETHGNSRPVIYIHRISSQANINLNAYYGYLGRPRTTHRSGNLYRVNFDVEEMKGALR